MKKRLLAAAIVLAALWWAGSGRTDLGEYAARFYRRLFQREEARAVFGVEEEEMLEVFNAWEEEPGQV